MAQSLFNKRTQSICANRDCRTVGASEIYNPVFKFQPIISTEGLFWFTIIGVYRPFIKPQGVFPQGLGPLKKANHSFTDMMGGLFEKYRFLYRILSLDL